MSAPKTTDPSILRKFELSKKEEDLKKRLFQKKTGSNQPTPTKSVATSKTNLKKSDSIKKEEKELVRAQVINVPDQAVDKFFKEMEDEFHQINKKIIEQVTVGMLNNQNEILKRHTEILNENQKSIAYIINENTNPNL